MKNLKLLISILFVCIAYSIKGQSISVVYKETMVSNPIDTLGVTSGDYKMVMFREMEKVKGLLENVEYLLQANQNEALFRHREFMENDANANMMNAIMASSADGKFYSNRAEDLYYWQIRESDGRFYRKIEADKTRNWTISKETRKIGKYTCYRATTEILLNNKVPIEVVAWFTPEIPFSVGPKGYGGLPGLIIALDERGFYFYTESIKFHEKDISIKKPTEGPLVTSSEYENLMTITQ